MANGAMLTIGAESMIVAAGIPPASTRLAGRTLSTPGAAPNEHCRAAPLHTCGQVMASQSNDVEGSQIAFVTIHHHPSRGLVRSQGRVRRLAVPPLFPARNWLAVFA